MSNVYGAGSPAAGLNAPGGAPPWLMNLWNYVNPMSQATAGSVDAQGRPQDAITAAQQALAAQALNGGPQQQGRPFAQSPVPPGIDPQNWHVPAPSAVSDSLTARPATPAMMASMVARGPGGGDGGGGGASGGWDTGINAALHPAAAPIVPPAVAAYAGGMPTPNQYHPEWNNMPAPGARDPSGVYAPKPAGTPSTTPRPHARQQAQIAAAAPQVPWITSDFDRQNLPAGNGPLGRNAQTKQGMLDLSKLFSRTG